MIFLDASKEHWTVDIIPVITKLRPHSFIGPFPNVAEQATRGPLERTGLSGMDAVRKIVETEGQARKVVEDAKTRAQQIISQAHQEAEMLRQEAISSAQKQREEILQNAKEKSEAEARQSDVETEQLLVNYRKLAEARKDDAVRKALDLILNS